MTSEHDLTMKHPHYIAGLDIAEAARMIYKKNLRKRLDKLEERIRKLNEEAHELERELWSSKCEAEAERLAEESAYWTARGMVQVELGRPDTSAELRASYEAKRTSNG